MLSKVLTTIFALFMIGFATSAAKVDGNRAVLTPTNTLVLRGTVTDESVGKIIKELQLRQGKDLFLYIYSPGGDIMAGQHLIEQMQTFSGHITCIADVAISMAFVIMENCEVRKVLTSGLMMQHEASFGMKGDAPHNFSMMAFLTRTLRRMDEAQAKRIGIPYDDFKRHTAVDWWMDGTEAIANHVVDGAVQVVCTKELTDRVDREEVDLLIVKISIEWSGCPLMHTPQKISVNGAPGANPQEANRKARDMIDSMTNFTGDQDQYMKALGAFERIR